jgi:hypothetical protein
MKSSEIQPIKGIVICKETGEYLLDLILDTDIDPVLLSSFVGALALFSLSNLGKLEEIIVKGLNIEMFIVSRNHLILVIIFDKNWGSGIIHEEAEEALNMFYYTYKDEINKIPIDVSKLESFKNLLNIQIKSYFKKVGKNKEIKDFGFFTEAIKKQRNGRLDLF